MRTAGRTAAVVAILLATVASVWLAAWPCFYTGTTSGPGGESTTCASLIAVNGTWVIGYLTIPPVLTVVAFFTLVAGRRAATWTVAILLFALCILAAWSIGLFYLPSAAALLIAAPRMSRTRASADPPRTTVAHE